MSKPRVLEEQVEASCPACSKEWASTNALSIASRHHASTGHDVYVSIVKTMVYSS